MKIVKVEVFPVSLPLKKPFRIALGELLVKEAPAIPIFVTKETIGYSKKLKGVINSPLELTYLDAKTYLEK